MQESTIKKRVLLSIFPFLSWIRDYRFSYFRSDLVAGISVALILIPQSMAYAILAGLPPIMGLYAAAVTPFFGAMWGSLKQLSTGPIAILSLLVLTTLSTVAEPGSALFAQYAVLLALIVGGLYILIGIFRFGKIMSFISLSSVKGFTSAAALIIISTQLPHLLGVKVGDGEYFFPAIYNTIKGLPDLHLPTFIVGISSMIVIFIVQKIKKMPPGLIALLLASVAVGVFHLEDYGVPIVGKISGGLPSPRLPGINMEIISHLFGPALVIALVSFVETYSIGKSISLETKQKIDVNQEFIGQGLANMFGALFQGYPVSGSFARTAINYSTGAKTAFASLITSFVVILTLLFFTKLLYYMPRATLSAMVVSAVFILFHPRQLLKLFKKNSDDGVVALTVFILALITKPDYALLIGITVSLIFFLWKTMHPRIIRVTRDLGYKTFLNADEFNFPSCPQIFQLRSDNSIIYANAEYTIEQMEKRLEEASDGTKFLLLDFQAVSFMDLTGIEELRKFKDGLSEKNIKLAIMGIQNPVRDVFISTSFFNELESDLIIDDRREAISILFEKIDHEYCKFKCPYKLFVNCETVK